MFRASKQASSSGGSSSGVQSSTVTTTTIRTPNASSSNSNNNNDVKIVEGIKFSGERPRFNKGPAKSTTEDGSGTPNTGGGGPGRRPSFGNARK